jgi:predicted nucleic acid-binding protein
MERLFVDTSAWFAYFNRADFARAWRQFECEHDKSYSYTDCTSFAVMERLGISMAAAVDADFRRAGFRTLPDP